MLISIGGYFICDGPIDCIDFWTENHDTARCPPFFTLAMPCVANESALDDIRRRLSIHAQFHEQASLFLATLGTTNMALCTTNMAWWTRCTMVHKHCAPPIWDATWEVVKKES